MIRKYEFTMVSSVKSLSKVRLIRKQFLRMGRGTQCPGGVAGAGKHSSLAGPAPPPPPPRKGAEGSTYTFA